MNINCPRRWRCVACWLLVLWLASGPAWLAKRLLAEPAPTAPERQDAQTPQADDDAARPGTDWVRVLKDDDGQPLGMQTAVVRYRSTESPELTVDLVGAVHVGDAAYYDTLNKRFEQYDALLYELVAPEGTVVQPGERASSRNALGALQNGMKNMLELEHQLEKVDYTKPNFVHADMSPGEFFDSMDSRGESFLQMYFRLMGQSIAHQNAMTAKGASPDIDIMRALFAKDRARQLKIAMSGQLSEMESLLTGFGGEGGSTLITERNKAALKVLRREIDAGKKKIGVFYGAGHLADMDERLRTEFAMQPVAVEWLTAWDLQPKDQ